MQITITDDGIKVTDALKQYILDKFKRLERITHKTTTIHITLSLENLDDYYGGYGSTFIDDEKSKIQSYTLEEVQNKFNLKFLA